ncbi:hypothetical protein B5S31_g1256 [[Candida] boidinii]|nr:hypothetical protein B5S29_g300 [[Candida] boidinii]OWB71566.1 hypothetical protein B5S31_g1256 [[Candida] boidinii]OWB76333.1 hypothetical protein B5S32_g484 [[Candida] boidinii]
MNDQNKFDNANSDLKLFDFDLDANESNDLDTNNFNFDDAIGDQPTLDGSNNQLDSSNSSSNLLMDDNDALGNQQQHRRSRASGDILTLLVHEFNKNSNPSTSTRKAISNKTGMSERSVRIWFQNRRAKARKIEKLSQNDSNSSNGGANRRSSNESSSKFLGGKKAQSFSSFQNQQKLPISINEKYSLIDCISVSVGPWQRIKSGYLNGAILKNLHNLSPRLLNNLMLTTDLLIILSKRDNELNYFFSGVFQNEKVLFRIFFPLANILNCSLINNQTQQTITTNYSNNTASTTTTFNSGVVDGESTTNSNPSSTTGVAAGVSTASNTTDDTTGVPSSSTGAGQTSSNTSPNNTDTSPDNVSGNQRNSLYNDEFDYPEHSQLRLQLTSPPKFAVYFLRDPTTGQENANQWSICEDFSEDQQVVSAYVGEGGTKIPHILTGDLDYLQYLNSWIVSYNQYHSAHQNNQLSQQLISQQIDDLILRNNSNNNSMNDNNNNNGDNTNQQQHNNSTVNLNDNMNTLNINNTQNNNINSNNHNNNDNPDHADMLFNDNLFSRDFNDNTLVNSHTDMTSNAGDLPTFSNPNIEIPDGDFNAQPLTLNNNPNNINNHGNNINPGPIINRNAPHGINPSINPNDNPLGFDVRGVKLETTDSPQLDMFNNINDHFSNLAPGPFSGTGGDDGTALMLDVNNVGMHGGSSNANHLSNPNSTGMLSKDSNLMHDNDLYTFDDNAHELNF